MTFVRKKKEFKENLVSCFLIGYMARSNRLLKMGHCWKVCTECSMSIVVPGYQTARYQLSVLCE